MGRTVKALLPCYLHQEAFGRNANLPFIGSDDRDPESAEARMNVSTRDPGMLVCVLQLETEARSVRQSDKEPTGYLEED